MVDKVEAIEVTQVMTPTQKDIDAATAWWLVNHEMPVPQNLIMAFAGHAVDRPLVDANLVERVAKAMYDAVHSGLRNCYAWEDAWEDHQEHHRDRYYKEARAAIAAMIPTPTQDTRDRVKVLEEFVREYVRAWEAGTGTVYLIDRARTALGNKETDRG